MSDHADRIEHHADAILRAAGSGLHNYSLFSVRKAILMATLACYEEAYRAGADFALRAAAEAARKEQA